MLRKKEKEVAVCVTFCFSASRLFTFFFPSSFRRRGRGVRFRSERQQRWRQDAQRRQPHPPLAVPEGAAAEPGRARLLHTLAGPQQGRLQDRGLGARGAALGQAEESARHELRQAQPQHPAVLQEGHHEEDGAQSETGVPVLPSLLSVRSLCFTPSPLILISLLLPLFTPSPPNPRFPPRTRAFACDPERVTSGGAQPEESSFHRKVNDPPCSILLALITSSHGRVHLVRPFWATIFVFAFIFSSLSFSSSSSFIYLSLSFLEFFFFFFFLITYHLRRALIAKWRREQVEIRQRKGKKWCNPSPSVLTIACRHQSSDPRTRARYVARTCLSARNIYSLLLLLARFAVPRNGSERYERTGAIRATRESERIYFLYETLLHAEMEHASRSDGRPSRDSRVARFDE